ncbi:maleylpyruvate isomerase family mycothiol-dependent enzyme [Kocuria sp. LUK]|uniref:maleylpyruvate isomerase family mycothiol-dependent enzyme n=1 Tax=Kocuria sp. LUK TaxID=2897828 RepID=UPI001E420FFA|nr:maleylpyruvate isomerase family mycothiol-dependent enzyme [Kocuria sp. LUK]MCD1144718.1 maleylpyruvate isomerase family mycothiol-dependent enzyme [Kocuria sp. LUK]
MDENELWAAIDDQRLRTAELLERLTPEQWARPSLCAGWTVRDVAAHLTLQQMGPAQALRSALRHPGGVNRMIRESARERAALPPRELVDRLRASVGSRRHNVGLTAQETLIDVLVHGQDIALPLGLDLTVPVEAAAVAAQRVWRSLGGLRSKVFADLPLEGLRLAATDAPWAVGEGPEVRGPVAALLLLLTGRTARLAELTGDGATVLRERLDGRLGAGPGGA